MKKLVLNVPEQAFLLDPGGYELLEQKSAGAAGFFVNPDSTINTYHQFPGWTSVDQYKADTAELGKQIRFPCVVVKGE